MRRNALLIMIQVFLDFFRGLGRLVAGSGDKLQNPVDLLLVLGQLFVVLVLLFSVDLFNFLLLKVEILDPFELDL